MSTFVTLAYYVRQQQRQECNQLPSSQQRRKTTATSTTRRPSEALQREGLQYAVSCDYRSIIGRSLFAWRWLVASSCFDGLKQVVACAYHFVWVSLCRRAISTFLNQMYELFVDPATLQTPTLQSLHGPPISYIHFVYRLRAQCSM